MTQKRSRKPIVSNMNQFEHFNDNGENHWYHPQLSSSPPSSLSVNDSYTHPSPSSATMGSWGFDVNRSTNGQTPLSFTSNNNNNNTMMRTTKDYNEHFFDRNSSPQNFQLRTPTLTKQRNGNEFSAVDRLVLGPNRIVQTDYYPSDDKFQQKPKPMIPINQKKTQTEQELLAWQNRMLQRDQRVENPVPNIRNETNSTRSSIRQIPTSIRPTSATSNMTENQHDHHEATIKAARVIKRYIELLYHLQSFYERITNQLFNENNLLKNNQSIFVNHCRKISDQLEITKPIWEEKLSDLQNLLKNISTFQWSPSESETTFLQRRSNLINLLQTLTIQKDLDNTQLSIRSDIDRVLHEDKLAIQLQDELSTLLQHQSLLNDFTSLLQWNRQIYSSNEQNRVDNVLPLLREQITTTDSYISHVSQQLAELVTNLRSLEKYILSYTNTVPSMDDATVPSQRTSSNRSRWRPYDETDLESIRTKESHNTNDNSTKTRSISMPRYNASEEFADNFDHDDIRFTTEKNNIHLNTNNSNNNRTSSARLATIKSAKRDQKAPLSSILKLTSNRRKKDSESFKPDKVDIPDRLMVFDNDEQILTSNERLSKLKKKDDVRKMISKQNIHEINDQDFSDGDIRSSFNQRKFEKALSLQSILAEEAKEKSRQVAAKHHMNKSHQRRSIYPNS